MGPFTIDVNGLVGEGGLEKKLTNVDQTLGLGEGGLVKFDIHKMKEILEDENIEKQDKY